MIYLITHANCSDGLASAFLVENHYGKENVHTYFCQYGDVFPFDPKGKHILIIDFSFPREILDKVYKECESLEVYDHHKSAKTELEGLDYANFDENECGCSLYYKLFCDDINHNVAMFVQYTRDHDLWLFEEEESRAVRLYFKCFQSVQDIEEAINDSVNTWIERGKAIERYQKKLIDESITHPRTIKLGRVSDSVEVLGVPCNLSPLISEVAHRLALLSPSGIGCTWFDTENGERVYSLRSIAGVDCLPIAQYYGGGGHLKACGFKVPSQC